MRNNAFMKTVAVVLAVLSLAVVVISSIGILFSVNTGLFGADYATWQQRYQEDEAYRLAVALAESYATRALGGFTRQEQKYIGWGNEPEKIGLMRDLTKGSWCYTVAKNGLVCETDYTKTFDGQKQYRFDISVEYPRKTTKSGSWDYVHHIYDTGAGAPTVPNGEDANLYVEMKTSPKYTVTVCFMPDAVTEYNGIPLALCAFLVKTQNWMLMAWTIGFVLTALSFLWLLVMARKENDYGYVEVRGINAMPLDLYGVLAAMLVALCIASARICAEECIYSQGAETALWSVCAVGLVSVGMLGIVGFLCALVAQWVNGFAELLRRTVLGRCAGWLWGVLKKCYRVLCKLYNLLPLIWQYLLTALAMVAVPLLLLAFAASTYGFFRGFWLLTFFSSLIADVLLVLYGAYAFGTLLRGAERMAEGDMGAKVALGRLYGAYKRGGACLNALSDVAVTAAKKQMKSEHMKAELITNVSHDIKTPLTSIINYIDLLQKAETEQQRTEYLQVLERQSQRLKKLIEDLMDMSKASTGNLNVEIAPLDAVEAVNQALGEFADKLKGQSLTVVFNPPAGAVAMQADGKLTWRVLSNILSNAVKYAMPGTRVYVDIADAESYVTVSIKNISAEPLNISAEELMERFVRGDASRNTEGSGLGLNIAQSLMQLQKGSLTLTVDGDLFKTTLQFPKCN